MSVAATLAPPRPWIGRSAGRAVIIVVLLGFLLAASWIAPYDPRALSGLPMSPPQRAHPLGTNDLGQDLVSLWLYGGRVSLTLGVVVSGLSTLLAGAMGAMSVLLPAGRGMILGVTDALLALPHLPLLVVIVALVGGGLVRTAAALVLLGWPAYARVVRSQVLVTMTRPYVEASRVLGASGLRIARTCVLPEIAPILWTKFLLTVRWAIVMEATLALLGLGDPGQVSWGTMLQTAFTYPLLFVGDAWLRWALPPAVSIALLTLALAALDPT